MEGDAALGLPDKDTHMRSSGPEPKPLSVAGQAGQNPRPGSRAVGALWAAGVEGLGAGPHEEDAPNPNRGLWQQIETEHSPEGADSAARGRQGRAVGFWWGWVDFL